MVAFVLLACHQHQAQILRGEHGARTAAVAAAADVDDVGKRLSLRVRPTAGAGGGGDWWCAVAIDP